MRNSPDWSHACSSCRLEWRPSRLLVVALVALGALAALSVMASALPPLVRCLLAGIAFGSGLHAAGREARRLPAILDWEGGAQPARWHREGRTRELHGLDVEMRGGLVCVSGRERGGRRHRLVFWPDTLGREDRRRLRLFARPHRRADNPTPSMAA